VIIVCCPAGKEVIMGMIIAVAVEKRKKRLI
jgi:hypothetical protein